jgi:rod shape-determining protein MreD
MIWKRAVLLALLAVAGLAIETSLLGSMTLWGARPELLLLFTVAIALGEGPSFGMTAGFVLGIATDVTLQKPQGVTALTFMLVGYAVGRVRAQMQTPSAWLPMAMVFLATFAGVLFAGGFAVVLRAGPPGLLILRDAALAAVYNALLTPFVFPLVRALSSRLRPTRVAG